MSGLSALLAVVLAQGVQYAPGFVISRGRTGGGTPVPNEFVCYGDSIMAGACSATPPCELLAQSISGATSANEAVSGYTADQISTCYFDGVMGQCNAYSDQAIVVIEGGVNSLKGGDAVTSVVEPATVATMREIVEDALGRARRVVWLDVLPYATCAPEACPVVTDAHLRATTYNSLKSAACAAINNPRLQCLSLYQDFEDPEEDGALSSTYACADDFIHLKQAGSNRLACRILIALGRTCPEGW